MSDTFTFWVIWSVLINIKSLITAASIYNLMQRVGFSLLDSYCKMFTWSGERLIPNLESWFLAKYFFKSQEALEVSSNCWLCERIVWKQNCHCIHAIQRPKCLCEHIKFVQQSRVRTLMLVRCNCCCKKVAHWKPFTSLDLHVLSTSLDRADMSLTSSVELFNVVHLYDSSLQNVTKYFGSKDLCVGDAVGKLGVCCHCQYMGFQSLVSLHCSYPTSAS